MKKRIVFIFMFLCIFILTGCIDDNPDDGGGKQSVEELIQEVENCIKEEMPFITDEDLSLFTSYGDIEIEWSSDNEAIDEDGIVTVNKSKAIKVNLSYTLKYGDFTKDGGFVVIVSPVTMEDIALRFENQFSTLISRDYEITTIYYDLFVVDWNSSNPEIFDNDGKFHRPANETEFEISYTVRLEDNVSEIKSFKLKAQGVTDAEKIRETNKWLQEEALDDYYLSGDGFSLPTKYEKYDVDIVWTSSNPDVISTDGKITHYVFERYITLIGSYTLESGASGSETFEVIVSPLDTSKMTKQEILENFLSAIAVKEYSGVKFGYSECPNLNLSFGSIYFYENKNAEIVEMYIPKGSGNRSGKTMDPQLVVIHDTANYNAPALNNAQYVQNGYGGGSTSWHYTVGNDGIYQTLPENEKGAHANGSSSDVLTWLNTGIKATKLKPKVSVGDDYYIYVDGIKTKYVLQNKNLKFASDGVLCEIKNGYYYIAQSWACTSHGFNANMGGNGSGIGIESAVNKGSDYNLTVRIMAKLVAEILIRNNLTINRVVQHNTMAGKNCPQAIRQANFWYTFKDLVSMEKFAKENLNEYNFTWKSNSSNMDNTGMIDLNPEKDSKVNYSVEVTLNNLKVFEKTYETKLIVK